MQTVTNKYTNMLLRYNFLTVKSMKMSVAFIHP